MDGVFDYVKATSLALESRPSDPPLHTSPAISYAVGPASGLGALCGLTTMPLSPNLPSP